MNVYTAILFSKILPVIPRCLRRNEAFMEQTFLFVRTTSTTVTAFWELPEKATADTVYEVCLTDDTGDTKTVCVAKTHDTFKELTPDTHYRISVRMDDRLIGETTAHTSALRKRIDVTKAPYFAKGDGVTFNTVALQQAFNDCGSDEEVYFPAGIYLTGALDLHSNMAVYLDKGAVLQGSSEPKDYLPRIRSRFEGTEQECYRSLLNAGQLDHTAGANCENILLYGEGTINGGGRILADRTIESERENLKDYLAANAALVATCENDRTIPGRVRGRLINLSNCAHVRITGLILQNGAAWNVHMVYSDDIVTDHCTLRSSGIWNGDGWDPDSSTNCTLFAMEFDTEDDSVAIKSGKNPEGNEINRPTKHIRIFDCHSTGGHGICIGSEMSGGVKDVKIWDCSIATSSNGIEIKGTPKRGGYVRDITVKDCIFPRLLIHSVPYNDDGIPAPEPPYFENYLFERLCLTGQKSEHGETEMVAPIELEGFTAPGHKIKNVTLRDCTLPEHAELKLALYENLTLSGLQTVNMTHPE